MASKGCFMHHHNAGVELNDLQTSILHCKSIFQILATLRSLPFCNYLLDMWLLFLCQTGVLVWDTLYPAVTPSLLMPIKGNISPTTSTVLFAVYRVMNLYGTASGLKRSLYDVNVVMFCHEVPRRASSSIVFIQFQIGLRLDSRLDDNYLLK